MPSDKPSVGPTSKPSTKPKPAKKVQLERTGVLWAIDPEGGLQILNGEESEANAVDYYGLYWNAKAGPKKINGKNAPVFTHAHATCDMLHGLCVCFMCVHTLMCVFFRDFRVGVVE